MNLLGIDLNFLPSCSEASVDNTVRAVFPCPNFSRLSAIG